MMRPSLKSFLMFFPARVLKMVEITGVGKSNFAGLVGVDPNSLFTALEDGGGKSLLEAEECHI
jgi:hypothetical protein